MKVKIAASLLLAGCVVPASGFVLTEENSGRDGIFIGVKETIPPGSPHMPAYNPFYAELMNGYVILGCYSSIGTVDVSLTSTAGDDYSIEFDTSTGAILIPISGNTGEYTLLIVTGTGVEFIGEFEI